MTISSSLRGPDVAAALQKLAARKASAIRLPSPDKNAVEEIATLLDNSPAAESADLEPSGIVAAVFEDDAHAKDALSRSPLARSAPDPTTISPNNPGFQFNFSQAAETGLISGGAGMFAAGLINFASGNSDPFWRTIAIVVGSAVAGGVAGGLGSSLWIRMNNNGTSELGLGSAPFAAGGRGSE